MGKRNMSEVILSRTTPEERQRLERVAHECGMSVSEMIRMLLTKRRVEVTEIPDPQFDVSYATE